MQPAPVLTFGIVQALVLALRLLGRLFRQSRQLQITQQFHICACTHSVLSKRALKTFKNLFFAFFSAICVKIAADMYRIFPKT